MYFLTWSCWEWLVSEWAGGKQNESWKFLLDHLAWRDVSQSFPFHVELEDEAFFVLEFTCLTALCILDALSFLDDLSGLSGLPGLSGLSGFPGLLTERVLGSGDFLLVIEDGFFPSQ